MGSGAFWSSMRERIEDVVGHDIAALVTYRTPALRWAGDFLGSGAFWSAMRERFEDVVGHDIASLVAVARLLWWGRAPRG